MPEVHFLGRILNCFGFEGSGFWARYSIHMGEQWQCISGVIQGQTHIDFPIVGNNAIWSHPIDWHFSTSSLKGWPRIFIQVFQRDIYGRDDLCGYGVSFLPSEPGNYELEIQCWQPVGTLSQRIQAFFVGGAPQLEDDSFAFTDSSRFQLESQTTGIVHIDINMIARNFRPQGVQLSLKP
eukprot:TRINITY_DN7288_c0_g1_i1.p1 TRINITY_DN7288_c0_g1~~TRINITY_DN7288_c0_g1_i1.p1  ORF type:complete len:188 (+),score=41.04 TRINITY_DN7288_c0_g1_i1:27-566(+)